MVSFDEQAFICDMAETYRIYDYRSLPVSLVATLAAGLRDNSRIRMKMAGINGTSEEILLSTIADRLGLILYMFGGGKAKQPESIAEKYYVNTEKKQEQEYESFSSPEAFREAWNKAIGGS